MSRVNHLVKKLVAIEKDRHGFCICQGPARYADAFVYRDILRRIGNEVPSEMVARVNYMLSDSINRAEHHATEGLVKKYR